MPVLVTGASGFLGGRLVELLAARGESVTVVARAGSSVSHLAGLPIRIVRAELSLNDTLREALRGVRRIYHCAGCSTDWARPAVYSQGNHLSTQALLTLAAEARENGSAPLERFLHVSTTDVYGYPVEPCSEDVEPRDVGLGYNHTKILGERAVLRAGEAGLPVTVVRPATIYGPRGKAFVTDIAELLRQFTMAYVDGGRVPGGFVYVDDVAEAMIAAADAPVALGQVYNLSSLQRESWRAYVIALARELGLRRPWINLPFGVAMSLAAVLEAPHKLGLPGRPLLTRHAVYLLGRDQEFPSAKAQRDFGYAPMVGLDEGVALSAAWLRGVKA